MDALRQKYVAIDINFDSLGEAYGFPLGYKDPSFFEVAERFFKIAEKYKFRYSIYIIGKDLEKPENLKRVREWGSEGHEIGNHSWSHPLNLSTMSKSEIRRQVKMAHEIITAAAGYEPRGFISPGWSTSHKLIETLIELNYAYDTSVFPSWLIFPAYLKVLLNNVNDKRFFRALDRRDFFRHLFGQRYPYNSGNLSGKEIIILPLPANRYRVVCWHTLVFMFGWKVYEKILRSCLEEVEAFYYLIHPADLIDKSDLKTGHGINMERVTAPLKLKQRYLERAIEIILESGREIITMGELAGKQRRLLCLKK